MKAVTYYDYGAPDVLKIEDIDMPAVGDDEVLINVRATSITPRTWRDKS